MIKNVLEERGMSVGCVAKGGGGGVVICLCNRKKTGIVLDLNVLIKCQDGVPSEHADPNMQTWNHRSTAVLYHFAS